MESRLNELHPLKRFKLRHQQEEEEVIMEKKDLVSSNLPAKKRKKSSDLSPPSTPFQTRSTTTTTYCLPAKKRVWAFKPPTPEKQPIFDLNLEYHQTPEKKSFPSRKNLTFSPNSLSGDFKKEEEEEDDGIVCEVCQSTDGDPSDPIVFCDGCDLMVHSTCYGDPLIKGIPEGDWFCFSCQSKNESVDKERETSHDCCLCPVKGGALKPTTDGRLAHILCALLVPEVFFKNPEGREDIDCSRVPNKRWKEVCYVCKSVNGCVIECSEPKCELGFHVTCGLKDELSIEYKQGRRGGVVAGFCKTHTILWEKQQQTGKFKIVARDEDKM